MGVGTYALTSSANLKSYLNLSVATHDTLLENLIDRTTELFENFTNRKLKARDYSYISTAAAYDSDNATIDGNGRDAIPAPQFPINSLTTLRVDTMEIDARGGVNQSGYVLDKASGIIRLAGYIFGKGLRNVELVYNAGYSTVPEDLEQACIEQAAWAFRESGAGSALLGVSAKTMPDGSISYTTKDLLATVKMVLNRHKRRFAV